MLNYKEMYLHLMRETEKAIRIGRRSIGDFPASKRPFSGNTASKSHGRRQPCRGSFPCLAQKISLFEVLCSFTADIFSCNERRGCGNTWCIAKTRRKLWGKRSS